MTLPNGTVVTRFGKYISIERQIEKTKDRYYDVLETSGIGWQEEKNDPTLFIRYMLTRRFAFVPPLYRTNGEKL